LPATTPQTIPSVTPEPADTRLGPPRRPSRRLPNPEKGGTPPPAPDPWGWPF
jgi:hypothetical protein